MDIDFNRIVERAQRNLVIESVGIDQPFLGRSDIVAQPSLERVDSFGIGETVRPNLQRSFA